MNVHKNAKLTPAGRGLLVKRVLFEDQSVAEVSRSMGVSPRTGRKWVKRYQAEGERGLLDRSSRPKRSPRRLAQKLVRQIERLRRRRWTGLEIAAELRLAVSTVSVWLRRLGLGRLRNLEPMPVVVRYEKKRPGELVHLDTKKLGRIHGIGHRIHGNRRNELEGSVGRSCICAWMTPHGWPTPRFFQTNGRQRPQASWSDPWPGSENAMCWWSVS